MERTRAFDPGYHAGDPSGLMPTIQGIRCIFLKEIGKDLRSDRRKLLHTMVKRKQRISGCSGFQQLHQYSRREMLRVGSLGALGLSLGQVLKVEAAQKHFDSVEGPAKSVIQIILPGGIAAQETWNPKPEAPVEYRGPFGVNDTPIAGIKMGGIWPELSKIANKLTVVRSVAGKIPDHGQASYHMLRGYPMTPAIKHPTIGTVVNHEFERRGALPGYVSIGGGIDGETGYLGTEYGAFSTGSNPDAGTLDVRDLRLPDNIPMESFAHSQKVRNAINDTFRQLETNPAKLDTLDAYYKQAYEMMSSDAVRDSFDLSKESAKTKERYGLGRFFERTGGEAGMRMLLARRLVEAGARFVTLKYGSWDDHTNIKLSYENQMPAFDNALATLINDLDERGLLDSTLVWVTSEFGRTPKVNKVAGRDHWSRVFSVGMAGGGLKRGAFYGDSDITSSEIASDGVPLADLHSTIYKLIGINSDKELMAAGDRPMEIVEGGKPVDAIIG